MPNALKKCQEEKYKLEEEIKSKEKEIKGNNVVISEGNKNRKNALRIAIVAASGVVINTLVTKLNCNNSSIIKDNQPKIEQLSIEKDASQKEKNDVKIFIINSPIFKDSIIDKK